MLMGYAGKVINGKPSLVETAVLPENADIIIMVLPKGIETKTQADDKKRLYEAFEAAQEQSVINGTDKMTMEEIDAEIAAYRKEKRGA